MEVSYQRRGAHLQNSSLTILKLKIPEIAKMLKNKEINSLT